MVSPKAPLSLLRSTPANTIDDPDSEDIKSDLVAKKTLSKSYLLS